MTAEARCREGLDKLVAGVMSRDAYFALLDAQRDAQRAWEQRHFKYFGEV